MLVYQRILFLFLCCYSSVLLAQADQPGRWVFVSHQQKINTRWSLLVDAQSRFRNNPGSLGTLLLRAALQYELHKSHAIALGYASKNDWEQGDMGRQLFPEHRVYQQYQFTRETARAEVIARIRLEERFVKQTSFLFSQRVRLFGALQLPIFTDKEFTKGTYVQIQVEGFANILNQKRVNNSFFDQSRIQSAVGYRWNKHIDTGIGYMWWLQQEQEGLVSKNVLQLTVSTDF